MKGVDVLRDQYGNRIGEIQIDGSKRSWLTGISFGLAHMTRMTTYFAIGTERRWQRKRAR